MSIDNMDNLINYLHKQLEEIIKCKIDLDERDRDYYDGQINMINEIISYVLDM